MLCKYNPHTQFFVKCTENWHCLYSAAYTNVDKPNVLPTHTHTVYSHCHQMVLTPFKSRSNGKFGNIDPRLDKLGQFPLSFPKQKKRIRYNRGSKFMLSVVGILGSGTTCNYLKLAAILSQQAFPTSSQILFISRQSCPR